MEIIDSLGLINNKAKVKIDIFKMILGRITAKKKLRQLAEICVKAQVFSSRDAESVVLEIPGPGLVHMTAPKDIRVLDKEKIVFQ